MLVEQYENYEGFFDWVKSGWQKIKTTFTGGTKPKVSAPTTSIITKTSTAKLSFPSIEKQFGLQTTTSGGKLTFPALEKEFGLPHTTTDTEQFQKTLEIGLGGGKTISEQIAEINEQLGIDKIKLPTPQATSTKTTAGGWLGETFKTIFKEGVLPALTIGTQYATMKALGVKHPELIIFGQQAPTTQTIPIPVPTQTAPPPPPPPPEKKTEVIVIQPQPKQQPPSTHTATTQSSPPQRQQSQSTNQTAGLLQNKNMLLLLGGLLVALLLLRR